MKIAAATRLVILSAATLGSGTANAHSSEADCENPKNAIVRENCKHGLPPSVWDVNGAGDPTIQGFATDISYNAGETARFKIKTDSNKYRLDIFRLGYYQGNGARLIDTVRPVVELPQRQPPCLRNDETLLFDCGIWQVSADWDIPADAVSGLYFARATREDEVPDDPKIKNWRTDNSQFRYDPIHAVEGADPDLPPLHGQPDEVRRHAYGVNGRGRLRNALAEPRASHIWFVVRNDGRKAEMLFQTSDTTWQAYNGYGGYTTYGTFDFPYTHGPDPIIEPSVFNRSRAMRRAYHASYNRPFIVRGYRPVNMPLNAEYPAIRFFEANGYDMAYFSGVDSARRGQDILNYKVFMSVGHDEYWSGEQRRHVTAARDKGVHLMFLSGNDVYWKIRFEPSWAGWPAEEYRTLVVYKETQSTTKLDPEKDMWTGTWRDARPINPEGPQPENALTGTIFTVNAQRVDPLRVPSRYKGLRFWRNSDVAKMKDGDTMTLLKGLLGHEWNEDVDNGFRPAGLIRMSETHIDNVQYIQDHGSVFDTGSGTHHLVMYRAESGSLVFGAGTVQWSWGLDAHHDCDDPPRKNKYDIRLDVDYHAPDRNVQQATVNVLADMGVQPATLDPGLVRAEPSADAEPPTCNVASVSVDIKMGTVTVTGSAQDTGGGVVAAVEVKFGAGSWHPAEGTESWVFTWGNEPWHALYDDALEAVGAGGADEFQSQIMCRAVDDSLNMGPESSFLPPAAASGNNKDEL